MSGLASRLFCPLVSVSPKAAPAGPFFPRLAAPLYNTVYPFFNRFHVCPHGEQTSFSSLLIDKPSCLWRRLEIHYLVELKKHFPKVTESPNSLIYYPPLVQYTLLYTRSYRDYMNPIELCPRWQKIPVLDIVGHIYDMGEGMGYQDQWSSHRCHFVDPILEKNITKKGEYPFHYPLYLAVLFSDPKHRNPDPFLDTSKNGGKDSIMYQ